MNIDTAKDLNINDLLERLGHQATRRTPKDTWYIRPYGNENHASFHVSRDGRAWFDFGTGTGGNIIDLAMLLGDCRDVPQALSYLDSVTGHTAYSVPTVRQRLPVIAQPSYIVQTNRTMADRRGENWCRSRGLDVEACRPYLSDVYFNRSEKPSAKPLYGVGLPNYAGGYEVRTQPAGGMWIKSSIGPKSFTVFESEQPNAPWFQFEGLPDFCTFLTLRRPRPSDVNLLIMNGTGMTGAAIAYLETKPPGVLNLCPQHGSQGSLRSCEVFRQFIADNGWDGKDITYPTDQQDYNAWHMSVKGIGVAPAATASVRLTPKPGF